MRELKTFAAWVKTLPYKHKILVPGNHDAIFAIDRALPRCRQVLADAGVTLLVGEEITIDGIRIYGTPGQPEWGGLAFDIPRGDPDLAKLWAAVPTGVDVLVTHSPPSNTLDWTMRCGHAGCEELEKALERIKPRLHVFGHIHEAYGRRNIPFISLNCSACTIHHWPVNPPHIVDLENIP
jgi:Icc-related predicted phosphoesterase